MNKLKRIGLGMMAVVFGVMMVAFGEARDVVATSAEDCQNYLASGQYPAGEEEICKHMIEEINNNNNGNNNGGNDGGNTDGDGSYQEGMDLFKPVMGDTSLEERTTNIIKGVLYVVGIIAVVMVIIGGVQYATSAGDQNAVTKAKNTILYGIIGLVIAILAYAIVSFVVGRL